MINTKTLGHQTQDIDKEPTKRDRFVGKPQQENQCLKFTRIILKRLRVAEFAEPDRVQ